ncbi:MAG: ferrous iron transport protein A [Burkholderiales bacterium]|nr:MAG: ferrous iron transport protein A [Burkholderiales bacterium]
MLHAPAHQKLARAAAAERPAISFSVVRENNSQYINEMDNGSTTMGLDKLAKGQIANVAGFNAGDENLVAKLREIGFAEGDEVELLGKGWLGGAPLSIRLNRTVIALRKGEAALVQVELVQ